MLLQFLYLFLAYSPPAIGWEYGRCKCGPNDDCWPSQRRWNALDKVVSTDLIANTPVAQSCYSGPAYNQDTCENLSDLLKDQAFVSNNPIALSYPTNSCPPVNLSADPCSIGYTNTRPCFTEMEKKPVQGTCSIGDQPRFTVNATRVGDVIAGVTFARENNLRLVVRDTGHDLLRRSTGYGSLQIWIRYLRTGIVFQGRYEPSRSCPKSTWTGPAFFIGGGYTWSDIYPEAARHDVVVVGGGTPTVGCLGGWMQGGGHSPATHDYGLGADQVLEARVVLASGRLITASPCSYPEIFFAIRGGGPSSYGVVVSTVVKAHRSTPVTAQIFSLAPLNSSKTPDFMTALAKVYSSYPDLSDAGYSGYGSWSLYSPTPLIPGTTYTTAFIHTIAIFDKNISMAQSIFSPLLTALLPLNSTSLDIRIKYLSFPDYAQYYFTLSNISSPIGSSAALGSRLLDRSALTKDPVGLARMLNVTAGEPAQAVSNNIVFVGGGQVAQDAADPYSGVNPAWRKTYVHNIVARGWAPGSDNATIAAVHADVTNVKVGALKALAPDTGTYMNEADINDQDYNADFYGANLDKLRGVKQRWDPQGVFYCETCVGSEKWVERADGVLCPAAASSSDDDDGDGAGGWLSWLGGLLSSWNWPEIW